MIENKELVQEVAKTICYHNDPLKTDDYRNWIVEAEAALSVIAPYYEKQIAELKSQIPQWLPINENTPRDGTTILIYPHTDGTDVGEAFWDKHSGQWRSEYDREYPDVWQHLPKPPAE